ncbi:MAG: LysM peptidoglycan-binding domain-containing protein [Streptosporangiaceae bacterium]
MGRHSKTSRIRLPQGASTAAAAAPALVGVAAAFCLSQQAPALAAVQAATPATQAAHNSAVLDAAYHPARSLAPLLSANRHATEAKRAAALPAAYKVRPGDSLSKIAGRVYHNPAAWPAIYWRNHSKIHWADIITAGEVLRIPAEPARIPKGPSELAPAAPAVKTTAAYAPRHAAQAPAVQAAPAQAAPAQAAPAQAAAPAASYTGGTPGGAFGQCVVARESGGNPQIMNSTGHYGLYQFSAATWAAYGGNPAEFGDASAAEQNQVFANALAGGGESNWAPYDGC